MMHKRACIKQDRKCHFATCVNDLWFTTQMILLECEELIHSLLGSKNTSIFCRPLPAAGVNIYCTGGLVCSGYEGEALPRWSLNAMFSPGKIHLIFPCER